MILYLPLFYLLDFHDTFLSLLLSSSAPPPLLCPLMLSMNGGRQCCWQLPGWGSSSFLAALPLCLKAGIEFPTAPAGWIHCRSRGRVPSKWTNLSLLPIKPFSTVALTPQDSRVCSVLLRFQMAQPSGLQPFPVVASTDLSSRGV